MHSVLMTSPSLDSVSGMSSFVNGIIGRVEGYSVEHVEIGRKSGGSRTIGLIFRQVYRYLWTLLRVDIAHVNACFQYPSLIRDLFLVVMARASGKRVVVHMHGGKMGSCLHQHLLALCMFKALYHLSDLVLFLSTREVEALGLEDSSKVSVVSNGIDCFREKVGRRSEIDPLEVIYLGRLDVKKGLLDSIEALQIAQKKGLSVRLTLYGEGPDETILADKIKQLGIENVFLGGVIRGDAKQRVLEKADIFLMPSYFEGMPFALLEVMAYGVVPIVTAVGSMGEIVEDGICGFVVSTNSAAEIVASLDSIINDPAGLQRMAKESFLKVSNHYSITKTRIDLAQAYASLFT